MKPLLICDCDEVLLHMIRHFGTWLGDVHDIDVQLGAGDMLKSMTRRGGGPDLTIDDMRGYLDGFFPAEMHRQTLVPGADEAMQALGAIADIVILTNLAEHNVGPRSEQLARFGIVTRVEWNQGGKGDPVARLVAEHGNPVTVFVDDLAVHHDSVSRHAPQVHRLHMVAEPELAPHVPPAPAAHVRIDDWPAAQAWIADRFAAGAHAGA
ncbi:MAG: HAD family hydrolase [Sphingomonas sp.]|nr:HAD family hydrolase [Sphingomonas sp.]